MVSFASAASVAESRRAVRARRRLRATATRTSTLTRVGVGMPFVAITMRILAPTIVAVFLV
jgi:hypothetical protein